MRNPKRTSSTAAALMIGVGLVGFIMIFAASAKTSIKASIDRAFTGDFVVDSGTFGFGGLSPAARRVAREAARGPRRLRYRIGQVKVDGKAKFLSAVDPAPFDQILDLDFKTGRLTDLTDTSIAVDAKTARTRAGTSATP